MSDIDFILEQPQYEKSLTLALKEYAVWRYYTGLRAEDNTLKSIFPTSKTLNNNSYPTGNINFDLMGGLGGVNFIVFTGDKDVLNLFMNGANNIQWEALYLNDNGYDNFSKHVFPLNSNGDGSLEIIKRDVDKIVLIPVCLTPTKGGGQGFYSAMVPSKRAVKFTNKYLQENLGGQLLLNNNDDVNSGDLRILSYNTYPVKTQNERFTGTPVKKHNNWNDQHSLYYLGRNFPVTSTGDVDQDAQFDNLHPVTVRNVIDGISFNDGVPIDFNDPWFVKDANDNQSGMGDFIPFSSPYYPTGKFNQTSGGVFWNQTVNQGIYYSIRAPLIQDEFLTTTGKTHRFYFQNWSWSGASLQQVGSNPPGYDQKAVVFTSDNAEVKSHLKGTQLSNQTNAYNSNSQRKFVRTEDGFLHSVYESLGSAWYEISTNNGNTWQLVEGSVGAKNPSIDFFDNFIVIAYYYYTGGTDGIRIKSFKKDGNTYIFANVLEIDAIWCSTAPYPVVAVGWGSMTTDIPVMITWKQNPGNWNLPAGLYCRYARISYFNRYLYWVDGNTFQHIPNTTEYSSNPTLYGYLPSFTFYLAWQENDTQIKYSKAQAVGTAFQFSNYEIISTDNGFSKNYNPTITAFDDYEFDNVRIAWIAYRKTYSEELPPDGDPEEGEGAGDPVSLGETKVFFRSKINSIWSGFNSYGSSINSVNINRNTNNTFAFAWSEGSNNVNKFVRSDTPIQVYTTNTTGKHLQVGNYSNLNNMRLNAFTTSTTPFSFSLSNTFNNTTPEESIASAERQGIIVRDSTAFYFSIGDILINDELIYFEELPDSLRIDNRETLNSYLVSEPFNLTDYTTFYYGVQYGVTDSALAAEALSIGGYVNYKVELVDEQTGEILGTFDDVTFDYENIIQYENLAYQVNTQGIGNRICRLKLVVDDDLDFNYSIVTGYNNELSLAKRGFVQRTLNSKEVVETYDLSQNYPNPFNPSTVIKYQIPADGVVKLKIYDILGKEVTTLVNEQITAGKYELNFDAGNLASGVYIYRIQVNSASGGFVSSKKMMLLK